MLGQTLAIASNTFLESIRQPVYFILLLVGWLLQVLNTLLSTYSMGNTDSSEVTGDNKLLLDIGLATVFVVATLLAAFIATSVLSREIENKTALTVISKPVGRPIFVLGKYLGVTAAILVATVVLLIYLQLALRHKVMSTARDKPDLPVILFSLLAIGLSIGVGVWCNFFYGWVFSSITVVVLLPATLIAWLAVLLINKHWQIQPISTDIKPQVLLASACVLLATPVLSGVAIAASTRLGQVMTIFICAGVFMLGLMSNYMLGRRAFSNDFIEQIKSVEVVRDNDEDFRDAGDVWALTLKGPPEKPISVGDPIYYGPSSVGLALAVPRQEKFDADPNDPEAVVLLGAPKALIVRKADNSTNVYTIVNTGSIQVHRPPAPGDFIFQAPTDVSPVPWALWAIVPNLQYFWLVDAVTQTHTIPGRYVALTALYSLSQIVGLLSLSVMLFQKREVG